MNLIKQNYNERNHWNLINIKIKEMPTKEFNHEYNGFKLKIYNSSYKIYAPNNGKYKLKRHKDTYATSVGNNQNGKLYKRFESDEIALKKAKDFINEFLLK